MTDLKLVVEKISKDEKYKKLQKTMDVRLAYIMMVSNIEFDMPLSFTEAIEVLEAIEQPNQNLRKI